MRIYKLCEPGSDADTSHVEREVEYFMLLLNKGICCCVFLRIHFEFVQK